MSATAPRPDQPRKLTRWLAPLIALLLVAGIVYVASGDSGLSLSRLVEHRDEVDQFVSSHRATAVALYILLYVVVVALSVPGAVFLTITGGFLFGALVGAVAAVIGATARATIIFLIARTALGEPLLKRAGPRAKQMADGFRADAFSYLLFLRLVPAFPFFLVNLVPAFAGVKLGTFVAATALGIIPGGFVFALAGSGLDSILAAQQAKDILTPQLIGALVALALLSLVPVVVKRLRARRRAVE